MLNKDKSYTYEELKEIIKKAEKDVIKKLDEDLERANNGEKIDPMGKIVFSMQNMITAHEMGKMLLGEDK